MNVFSLLDTLLTLPLIGAGFILLIKGEENRVYKNTKSVALFITGCVFLVSLVCFFVFQTGQGVNNPTRLDALSLLFALMISLLTFLASFCLKKEGFKAPKEFAFLLLLTQSFMLFSICTQNALRFFVFWKACLLPLFLMIAVWGAEKKVFTAYKFCFSTFAGTTVLIPVMFLLYTRAGSLEFSEIASISLTLFEQKMVLLAFLLALMLSAPLFPFHSWLSEVQTEAPTPASVLLSCVFSKFIFYAFLRLCLPVIPQVLETYSPFIFVWIVFSALLGAFISLKQMEIKKMAGFAHLTQVSLLAVGLFCNSENALQGLLVLFVGQGLALAGYLMICDVISQRLLASGIKIPTGLMSIFPVLSSFFFLSCLAILAFPPFLSFVGQFLVFNGVFKAFSFGVVFLLLGVVLLYCSFFKLFTRVLFGQAPERSVEEADMTLSEKIFAFSLASFFLIVCLFPAPLLTLVQDVVQR